MHPRSSTADARRSSKDQHLLRKLLPETEKGNPTKIEERINMLTPPTDCSAENHSLTPQSTVTTETGNQLLYRLKNSGYAAGGRLTSDSSGSARNSPNDGGTTITSTQKFSMKQIAIFPPRLKRRVVLKNGVINVSKEHIERRHQRYLQDTFTTMVDIQWRWNLLVFALGFILSWLGFAVVWWTIGLAHGDFDEVNIKNGNWTPCVDSVTSFASAFLFSIETQHTIGYGGRATTEECPEAIFVMCLQSITGVVIQCFVVGFVFAKLSRPQKRSQTLLFSSNAVINMRDGRLCLMFRIGDVRNRSHIIGASVTAILIHKKLTAEGETIPFFQTQLPIQFDGSCESIFLIWPATFVHVIDESSPFYEYNYDALMREKLEVVVILEGTVESTGQSIQARSSYLSSEMLWGRRFVNLVSYKKDSGEHRVDYSKFNNTYEVNTPSCSARELDQLDQHESEGHKIFQDVFFKKNPELNLSNEDALRPKTVFVIKGEDNQPTSVYVQENIQTLPNER